jgi:hypothetical protein
VHVCFMLVTLLLRCVMCHVGVLLRQVHGVCSDYMHQGTLVFGPPSTAVESPACCPKD